MRDTRTPKEHPVELEYFLLLYFQTNFSLLIPSTFLNSTVETYKNIQKVESLIEISLNHHEKLIQFMEKKLQMDHVTKNKSTEYLLVETPEKQATLLKLYQKLVDSIANASIDHKRLSSTFNHEYEELLSHSQEFILVVDKNLEDFTTELRVNKEQKSKLFNVVQCSTE